METCQNCKHPRQAHANGACACGCAVFQTVNESLTFNSIKPGEEIMAEVERIRRLQRAKDTSGQ